MIKINELSHVQVTVLITMALTEIINKRKSEGDKAHRSVGNIKTNVLIEERIK